MNHFRTAMYSALIAAVLGLGACSMMQMMSGSSAVTGRLSGASEVPPVTGNASGTLDANLNKRTNVLSWTVTYSGLSGPVTGAHFHGPAMTGQNAGVAVPITGSLASPIKGDATLTAPQVAELMAGRWYVNLHTAAHPNGEIALRSTASLDLPLPMVCPETAARLPSHALVLGRHPPEETKIASATGKTPAPVRFPGHKCLESRASAGV